MIRTYPHDPAARLDYSWSWSGDPAATPPIPSWLEAGETIADKTVTGPAGITVESVTEPTPGVVVAWVKLTDPAVIPDGRVAIACKITTSAGRTDTRRKYLSIGPR